MTMGDEKSDVGLVCNSDVSESPVSVNLPGETLMENIGSEKQAEESYEVGDGGEIMVEVVGSDVLVDGVSGHKEGVVEGGEAGDLEGRVWESQGFLGAMNASSEGDGNKVEESKVGLTVSMDEQEHVIAEKLEVSFSESIDGGSDVVTKLPGRGVGDLNDEVSNSGIEAKAMLSPATTESITGQSEEVMERMSVVVSEEMAIEDEAVDKDRADIATPVLLNHLVEADFEGEVGVVGKVEIVHTGSIAASSLDIVGADYVTSHKAANTGAGGHDVPSELSLKSDCEGPDIGRVDGIGVVVEEVVLVNASAVHPINDSKIEPSHSVALDSTIPASDATASISGGGEVLATGSLKGEVLRANAENVRSSGDGGVDAIVVNENEAIAAGSEHLILESEDLVSSAQGGNQGCEKDFDGIKCEAVHGTDGVPHVGQESIHEHSLVSERGEVMGVDFDDILDFKDGNLSCPNDSECLKTDGDLETDGVRLNFVVSKEPTQVAGGVDPTELDGDKVLKVGIQPDMEDNQPNTTSSSCAGDEEILEADSGRYRNQPLICTSVVEVINDQKVAISQVKVVVGNGSPENGEEIDGGNIENPCVSDLVTTNVEVNKSEEAEDNSKKSNGDHIGEGHTSETKPMDVEEETELDQKYHGGTEVDCREPDFGTEEPASETENLKLLIEEPVKSVSSLRMNQSGYLPSPEHEGQFSISDLVWGKVRSYPWWPGQIFDPVDASEKAVKYYKKDSYLVAYFGDRTFAWNDASVLKPFRSHFSQIEKQSNSEAFLNAVNCALEEVSRRVELGLACSCVPKDAYEKIQTQVVESTGIREESSQRYGVDQSSKAASFEPDELLEYIRDLAPHASSGAHRLDLVIAQAQLSAFCRFNGFRLPTGFPSSRELLESDAVTEQTSDEMVASHKHKHTPKDSLLSRKERSLTELMGEVEYSSDSEDESAVRDPSKYVSMSSGKKRKALDPLAEGSDKRVSVYAAKVSTSTNQTPKPSFKIGECIRRVASQLTGSASMIKGHNDETGIDGSPKIHEHSERRSMVVSAEFSLNEMLSQLQLVAQDPKKGHSFLNTIFTFFMGFRNSIALNKRGRKRKTVTVVGGSAEEFEFDDVNDSYWTDRIVQNYSEEQLLQNCENGAVNLQVVPFDAEKSAKSGRKSHSRKRFSTGSYPTAAAESDENVKRRKQESSPAELILIFAERNCIPSEINLNKMFRRFGPLMESETEVDHDSGRARVIFKRGSDAEVAHNSAEKFNIFGPVLVNYEIGYSPLISVKILPLSVPQCQEDATLML